MAKKPLLSVVVPCYLQEGTIIKDLKKIKQVLDKIRYGWELIVVVDGRLDKTYQHAKKLASKKTRVFELKKNQGKGLATRFGLKKAKGDYVAFLDAGMEIDPNGISMLLEHIEWYEADIIVGSKRHLASKVNYPLSRKVLSIGYYWLARLLFGFKVKDTQAGIKVFKKEVLKKILPLLLVKSYAFDIELLSLAYRFGFKKIYEAPIKYQYQFASLTSAATLSSIWKMLWDTAAVFYRLKIVKYYDKKAKQIKE